MFAPSCNFRLVVYLSLILIECNLVLIECNLVLPECNLLSATRYFPSENFHVTMPHLAIGGLT
jgi:hypothetical protein